MSAAQKGIWTDYDQRAAECGGVALYGLDKELAEVRSRPRFVDDGSDQKPPDASLRDRSSLVVG
eukprot:7046893-Prymnesium_polylepis.1